MSNNKAFLQYYKNAPEFLAITFACDENNFPLFSQSAIFNEFFNEFFNASPSLELLKLCQDSITPLFDKHLQIPLQKHLLELLNANIIEKQHYQSLCKKLDSLCNKEAKNSTLNAIKTQIKSLHSKVKDIIKENKDETQLQTHFINLLDKISHNLDNQKFSIGVTGVLSAGKSSFLNALLGEEILATSTIPETANLTVLKFAKQQGAKVYFWNTQQWEDLTKESAFDKGLREFIKQSEEKFGDNLKRYILPNTHTQDITLDELSTYTSANHDSKMCNLIQKVELFTPLKFLENGVDIVDTPGLDDPIAKREEITKSYLNDCDLLIHLMNASCAATQVDIDFILETLLERNISRLLVVLTKIDLISKEELQQSLDYTKKSLEHQIKKISAKIDAKSVLSRITFLPISSYLKLSQSSSNTQNGFESLESYLDSMLLGENSVKHRDILFLANKNLAKITQNLMQDLNLKLKLLSANNEELQDFITQERAQNQALELKAKQTLTQIQSKNDELNSSLEVFQSILTQSLQTSQEVLKDRTLQNIIYANNQKRETTKENLKEGFLIALKDIFTDVSRDYKFKLNTKITQLLQEVQTQNLQENDNTLASPPTFSFYTKDEQVAHFADNLAKEVVKITTSANLSTKLDSIFSHTFVAFSELIFHKSNQTKQALLDFFNKIANGINEDFKAKIAHKEQIIQNALSQANRNDKEEMKSAINAHIKSLQNTTLQLKDLQNALES